MSRLPTGGGLHHSLIDRTSFGQAKGSLKLFDNGFCILALALMVLANGLDYLTLGERVIFLSL